MPEINSARVQNRQKKRAEKTRARNKKKKMQSPRGRSSANRSDSEENTRDSSSKNDSSQSTKNQKEDGSTTKKGDRSGEQATEMTTLQLWIVIAVLVGIFVFVLWAFVDDKETIMAKKRAAKREQQQREQSERLRAERKNFKFEFSNLMDGQSFSEIMGQLSDEESDWDRLLVMVFENSQRPEALSGTKEGDPPVQIDSTNYAENLKRIKLFKKFEGIAKSIPRKKLFKRFDEENLPYIGLFDCANPNDPNSEEICQSVLRGSENVPNILIFRRHSKPRPIPSEYRSDKSIIDYIYQLTQPAVKYLEERENAEDFVANDNQMNVVLFSPSIDEIYEAVADNLRDFGHFGRAKNPVIASEFDLDSSDLPAILLWRTHGAENPVQFLGNLSNPHEIQGFVLNNYLPVLGEFDAFSQRRYLKRGLPIVWIAYDGNDDSSEALLESAEIAAQGHVGAMSFVKLDVNRQPDLVQNLQIDIGDGDSAESEDEDEEDEHEETDEEDDDDDDDDEEDEDDDEDRDRSSKKKKDSKKLPQIIIMNQMANIREGIDLDDVDGTIEAVMREYYGHVQAQRMAQQGGSAMSELGDDSVDMSEFDEDFEEDEDDDDEDEIDEDNDDEADIDSDEGAAASEDKQEV